MKFWQPREIIIIHVKNTHQGFKYTCSKITNRRSINFGEFFNVDDILRKFGNYSAYWLHIDGVGVLTRILNNDIDHTKDLLINFNADDFYFSVNEYNNKVVSFIRKDLLNDITTKLESKKCFLMGVTVGEATYTLALKLFNIEKICIEHEIGIESNDQFYMKRDIEDNVRVDTSDSNISHSSFLNNILQHFFFKSVNTNFKTFQFADNVSELKEYIKFKRIGLTAFTIFLLVVCFNYLYINYLNRLIVDKEVDVSLYSSNQMILNKLEEEYVRKISLAENSENTTPYFIAYYLDEIGYSIPKELQLAELVVYPVVSELKDKRKVEVQKDKIEILGYTPESVYLDQWMSMLNKYTWVKSIELISYQREESTSKFKLLITIDQ